MRILGIDTSCDDTGVAVVEDGVDVKSNVIASQHGFHERYGGIVPSIAAQRHARVFHDVLAAALESAGVGYDDLDAIAVSCDQGLGPSLAVGVSAAKALSQALSKPLIGVHHVEGHIHSNVMEHGDRLTYPFLCLTVAGGHTMILLAHAFHRYELIGATRDDSAGEAYDKVARRLGLGYPGGPIIERLARSGDPKAFDFPRPLIHSGDSEFSFSGLKTAFNRKVDELEAAGALPLEDLAASFQDAVLDVLVSKTRGALAATGVNTLTVAGGVAANGLLVGRLEAMADELGATFFKPSKLLCIDNGAMIAGAAYHLAQKGLYADVSLDYRPNAPLGELGMRYKPSSKYAKKPQAAERT